MRPLLRNNVDWITLVPCGFQAEATKAELRIPSGLLGDWSRTDEGIARGYGRLENGAVP